MTAVPRRLTAGGLDVEIGPRPWLMGIVNASPDSFTQYSAWLPQALVSHIEAGGAPCSNHSSRAFATCSGAPTDSENPRGVSRGVTSVELDGKALAGHTAQLALDNDVGTHRVRITLG